jgi:hypothetical protein
MTKTVFSFHTISFSFICNVIFFILHINTSVSFSQDKKTDISYSQEFIIPNNAEKEDICGKFYYYFDYKPQNAVHYSIFSGNSNEIFTINPINGEIYIAKPILSPAVHQLQIKTADGEWYDIDTAFIRIVDSSQCIFVDPSRTLNGTGTRSRPFSSWKSVTSFKPGYCYLQKRGTTYYDEIYIPGPGGTVDNRIIIGAYGNGARPVLDGSKLNFEKAGIVVGIANNGAHYVDIFSFIVHTSKGIQIERHSYYTRIFDCETYNCTDNAGIYLKYREDTLDRKVNRNAELYNCISHDNVDGKHGIKAAPGTLLMNCCVYNNINANGISAFDNSKVYHCLAYKNTQYGIEGDGQNIEIVSSRTYANYIGINSTGVKNLLLKNNVSENNYFGICIDFSSYNANIHNNKIINNKTGIEITGMSDNVEVSRNLIINNAKQGILVQDNKNVHGINTNIYITYNLLYDNTGPGVVIKYAKNLFLYNNTIFQNNVTVLENTEAITIINNIAGNITGSYNGSNNLINPASEIFINVNDKDFHLNPTQYIAIDAGLDVNLNIDYDGNSVPNGKSPDIGAFEQNGISFNSPPVAPQNLSVILFNNFTCLITWTDSSNNEHGFELERSSGSLDKFQLIKSMPANSAKYIDDNLQPLTNYYYRIRAFNNAGYTEYSNVAHVITPDIAHNNNDSVPTDVIPQRITKGLVALYIFNNDSDNIIKDISGYKEPLNLMILDKKNIEWYNNSKLSLLGNNIIFSITPAYKIVEALKETNEITIECWIKSMDTDISEFSTIISLEEKVDERAFAINQFSVNNRQAKTYYYAASLLTGSNSNSGLPYLQPYNEIPYVQLHHLVYSKDLDGNEKIYLNGQISVQSVRKGDFSSWKDNYYLLLGNNINKQHPWNGTFYLIALYNKALSKHEIFSHYTIGPLDTIIQAEFNFNIKIYPNPFNNLLNIELEPIENADSYDKTLITLTDFRGIKYINEIVFDPSQPYNNTFNLNELQKGIYYLRLTSGKISKVFKIIKI